MNKKIILSVIVFAAVCLISIFCFAEQGNTTNTIDLKGEITNSIDKTRNTAGNVTNGIVGATNMMINGNMGRTMNNMTTNNNNNNNNNYNTTRTSVNDGYYAGGQMDTTTWLWMILAIVAIIIVAAVWYYALQGTNNRHDND